MKRNLIILTASLLAAVLMFSRSDVLRVLADCSDTGVDMSGATCSQGGSTPGTPGGGDSDSDGDGLPGSDGSDSNTGGGDANNNTGDGSSDASCSPGTVSSVNVFGTVGSSGISSGAGDFDTEGLVFQLPDGTYVDGSGIPADMCALIPASVDTCTGEVLEASVGGDNGTVDLAPCPGSAVIPDHPCDEFVVSGSGVTCVSDLTNEGSGGSSWEVSAHAGWPGNELHTRPYPVTLVDWDTVLRVAGLGTSSGSGRLAYAPWGGGSGSNPAAGDWKDIVLRLDIRPMADWADVFLENIGLLRLQIGHL